MWSFTIFMLFVASVWADAGPDADADAEPLLPYMYQSFDFGNDWAGIHFGTPQETLEVKEIHSEGHNTASRPSFGYEPAGVAPQSPLFGIPDVRSRPPFVMQLQKPKETHDTQVFRLPAFQFGKPLIIEEDGSLIEPEDEDEVPKPASFAPALAFAQQHTAQVPVFVQPELNEEKISIPASFAPELSFAQQHTAQLPPLFIQSHYPFFLQPPIFPSFFQPIPIPVPVAAPSYAIQHSAQVPVYPPTFIRTPPVKDDSVEEEEEDQENDVDQDNYIYVPHFPTALPSLTSLRGMDDEPVIPAGIVKATQPIFKPVKFVNSKAHPDLLKKSPSIRVDSPVIAV